MAKGWSFGALTSALKQAAFADIGTAAGNVIGVGTIGLALSSPVVVSSLDLKAYTFRTGEIITVVSSNVQNKPVNLVFDNSTILTFQVIGLGGTTRLLCTDSSSALYNITIAADKSVVYARKMATDFGGTMRTATDQIRVDGAGANKTVYFDNPNGTEGGAVLYESATQTLNLYAQTAGGKRCTINNQGDFAATGVLRSSDVSNESSMPRIICNSLYINSNRTVMNRAGTHMAWNEDGNTGRSNFINNKGGGVGGFTFRIVDQTNTNQSGSVTFDGGGSIVCTGTIQGARDVYAGSSHLGTDGNIYDGTAWGGSLLGWLAANVLSRNRYTSYGESTNGNNDNVYAEAPQGTVVVGVKQQTNYTGVHWRQPQSIRPTSNTWFNVEVS